ncbi:MAG TPA: penicillin-binding protein 2 [Gaiellaceae bacterium]|nr:penicillin-binding protein 2 [Gaiellaceae bacterium]
MTARRANKRIRLLVAVFAGVFALALARAGWLQAARGTIYDRTGVELAIGERATTVYANPKQIRDPRAVASAAARTLGIEGEPLVAELADRSRGFVYVKRKADPERAEALQRMGIRGLGFYPEERRRYPQQAIAAEVVGFAGVDNRGLAGVELGLDRQLAGAEGEKTVIRDPFGQALQVVESKPPREGRDVYLTVDHSLQAHVERVLRDTVSTWDAESATAVVMDAASGAILAMGVEPGFDANRFPSVPRDLQRNRAVTDTYEPGSTFKVVTITAALETGLVSPSTPFTLRYQIRVADRVIHDAEPRGTERMTVSEILSRSSNVGIVTLALWLGKERLSGWTERFGFGQPTGVDYPGETRGIVLPPERWSGSTIGNVPIGQGIAVTPLQMAAAYAAIANDGVAVQPHLVDRLEGDPPPAPHRRRVMSAETARQVREMLEDVVEEGSGVEAQVPGYRIAGKTGTAAKPEPTGGYSKSRYVASFVGFTPGEPRLVTLVAVDEPKGAIWGGVVAAPAFAEIARFALQYFGIGPDERFAPASP